VQPLLLWKSNKYHIFWVWVCILALGIQHAMRTLRIILSSVTSPALSHFSTSSYKRHDFRGGKKLIEQKMRVLIFSTRSV